MAWYRALRNLSNGIGKGQVFAGSRLQAASLPVLEQRKAIARRGTKAHKFLTRAFEDNRQRIIDTLERGVNGIVERKR